MIINVHVLFYRGEVTNVPKLIRITCPCNEHPLTPHFYIEKVGFTRVYIFSHFCSAEAVLTCTHNLCFEQKIRKMSKKFI